MDEQPNVNNLNGVPNFGHGMPEETSEASVASEETTPGAAEEAPASEEETSESASESETLPDNQ